MKHSRAVGAALVAFFLAGALLAVACGSDEPGSAVDQGRLLVATTTSLNDSGLLDDVVLPAYEELHPGVTVKVVAVGRARRWPWARRATPTCSWSTRPTTRRSSWRTATARCACPFAYNYFVIAGPRTTRRRRRAETRVRRIHRDR